MADRINTLLLFGAPGVGKGTQGKLLGHIPGMCHVATGDIFRSLDRQSELGRRVGGYMERGELVPDELTVELWRKYVEQLINSKRFAPGTGLLILDGIPRSADQARMIQPYTNVLKILHLVANDLDEIVMRMKRRALQENRPDDADEAVIRHRFEVYEAKTRPVLSCYDRSLVAEINAVGTPVEVLLGILQAIVPVYNKHCGNPLED
jgi:adenylate kinase